MKKSYLIFAITILLGVISCAPKSTVLRAPSNQAGVGSTDSKSSNLSLEEEEKQKKLKELEAAEKKKVATERTLTLLLPFQLDHINALGIQNNDIKRSALALDFYQGFQLGLEEVSKNTKPFNLKVVDSKDNAQYNSTLATSKEIDESGLIIGPIYPIEIKSFGANLPDRSKFIINPLAASPASEFGLNNLITITPSIKSHTNAIAKRVAQDYMIGDIVIVYNSTDNDSRQFLNGMLAAVKEHKPNVNIISVSTLAQLNERLIQTGTNIVVSGTTDKTQLNNLISNLSKKYSESFYSFKLFGHPLWDRFDFSIHTNFYSLRPIITTESNFKSWTNLARNFKDVYKSRYGVLPSDQSYKGYDVAVYFGKLIDKYGVNNMKSKLTEESYSGLYNTYKFIYNENWGFTNEAVSYKEFMHGTFQLQ